MKSLLKHYLDLKADNRSQKRDVRHLHCLVVKLSKNQPMGETGEESEVKDVISYYTPCDSHKNLQMLDMKLLGDTEFFDDAVRVIVSDN